MTVVVLGIKLPKMWFKVAIKRRGWPEYRWIDYDDLCRCKIVAIENRTAELMEMYGII